MVSKSPKESCGFLDGKLLDTGKCYSFFVVGESVALSLAIPMSAILETLMDDDMCGDAWVLTSSPLRGVCIKGTQITQIYDPKKYTSITLILKVSYDEAKVGQIQVEQEHHDVIICEILYYERNFAWIHIVL